MKIFLSMSGFFAVLLLLYDPALAQTKADAWDIEISPRFWYMMFNPTPFDDLTVAQQTNETAEFPLYGFSVNVKPAGFQNSYHRAECLTHVGDSQAVRSLTQCGEPMRFAMAAPIDLRNDFDSVSLRRLAKRTRDATQSRRLLALAEVYDGGSRTDASRIGGVGLQIIRDWVLRFNARGPDGLVDGKSPGAPSKLNADHRRALAEVVEAGPVPAVDGVVRWRRKDLARWLLETFAISLDETTVGRELKALGFAKISARPRHYAQNELAVEAFKKTSPPNWRRSGRGSRKASR